MMLNPSETKIMDDVETLSIPIQILYGTSTGNSEILAEETADKLNEIGLPTDLSGTDNFDAGKLYDIETLLLLMSTDDVGAPPVMAEGLYAFLSEKVKTDLGHLSYSILALGDSYYPDFCQAGKDFDYMLEKLGSHRITKRVDCDLQYWDDFDRWLGKVVSALTEKRQRLNCHA